MKCYSKSQKRLPKTYQNKTKISGKNSKCLVYLSESVSYINYTQAIYV